MVGKKKIDDTKIQIIQVIIYCIIVALIIMMYGTYRCRNSNYKDPLTKSIAGDNEELSKFIDGWGLIHFWFYALLFFKFPKAWYAIIIIGITWEIIESSLKDRPFYLAECKADLSDHSAGWWYGRWQDVVMNSLGMLTGYLMLKGGITTITPFIVSFFVLIGFQILI